ncbi:hypothetical protein [Streptomyces sp. NPDC015350]|uniref:hypothetical protein n=1 Tax=Streptomyces sp. NPDC015350 TaxID=3364955 RepID=UPI0036FAF653
MVRALEQRGRHAALGRDGALTALDREQAETSILALYLFPSSLGVNTLLLQQVLAEPKWEKKLTDEGRGGLTALFLSNVAPYDPFYLDVNRHLDLGAVVMSGPAPRLHLFSGFRGSPGIRIAVGEDVFSGVAAAVRERLGIEPQRVLKLSYALSRVRQCRLCFARVLGALDGKMLTEVRRKLGCELYGRGISRRLGGRAVPLRTGRGGPCAGCVPPA